MKRLLAVCLMIALLLPCAALAAEKTKVDRYEVTYETADGCCTIVSISDPLRGYGGALPMELPEQLGGYTVTVLGAEALAGHSTLGSLTLPASLERIEAGACRGAFKLSSVVVPGTLTFIADNAFEGCADGLTMYGPDGCYAQEWAAANGVPFFANNLVDTDFRSFCWGASVEDVIAAEGEPLTRDVSDVYAAGSIGYELSLLDKHNYLTCYFSETEGLYAAQYITTDLTTMEDAYAYVDALLTQISRKYGLAVLPRESRFVSAMSMSDAEALLTGNLEYGADFDTGRSQISVWLTGYDNFAYIYVYYCSQDILPRLRDQSGNF